MLLFIKTRAYNVFDFLRNAVFFYRNWQFFLIDVSLLIHYFWESPYRICRKEAKRLHFPSLEPYGETPLYTLAKIAKKAAISSNDIVYELGAGRGRTLFWLSTFCKCRAIGIECIPQFTEIATKIIRKFHISTVEIRTESFLTTTYTDATILYLFGPQLQDEEIMQLIENIGRQKITAKIITISFWLGEYKSQYTWQLVDTFHVTFPWGKTTAYIQRLKKNEGK